MKTYRYLLTLLAIMTGLAGQSQLVQVYPEVYAVDGVDGFTTYRIFAELEDPTDALSGVFAYAPHPLTIGSSGNVIYNDSFGATTGDAITTAFCDFVPTLCHDSFVTIGWAGQYNYLGDPIGCGQATTTISSLPNSHVIEDSFGNEIAENLNMEDGAWFSTNLGGCNTNLLGVGPNNKVLIAQVTIPSTDDLQYQINLQVFDEAIGSNNLMYVSTPPAAGEIDGSNMGLIYPNANCPDPAACNYNDQPDLDDDIAVCTYSCYGCTDSSACNFDPSASIDDGSCTTLCEGCTNSSASNY
ncbi:MAG: hypothetical protein KDC12_13990, partial [Flavobacteriales bacterium]|nr:hypothetical protein [Flavobacteriales bacterium]